MSGIAPFLLLSAAVFLGGFVSGFAGFAFSAVAGAILQSRQRGLVQPFIAAMQIFALTLMLLRRDLSSKILLDLVLSAPALLAGSALGIFAFRNVGETAFRRAILAILLLSGLLLVV